MPNIRGKKRIFRLHNENPANNIVGDDVIRAIAFATGKSWLDVYDELCALGRNRLAPPADGTVYQPYLDSMYPRVPEVYTDEDGKMKYHAASTLVDMYPTGTFILQLAHRLTTVKDGVCYDTWNASLHPAHIIWRIA